MIIKNKNSRAQVTRSEDIAKFVANITVNGKDYKFVATYVNRKFSKVVYDFRGVYDRDMWTALGIMADVLDGIDDIMAIDDMTDDASPRWGRND